MRDLPFAQRRRSDRSRPSYAVFYTIKYCAHPIYFLNPYGLYEIVSQIRIVLSRRTRRGKIITRFKH
jgi:hypothetical protein